MQRHLSGLLRLHLWSKWAGSISIFWWRHILSPAGTSYKIMQLLQKYKAVGNKWTKVDRALSQGSCQRGQPLHQNCEEGALGLHREVLHVLGNIFHMSKHMCKETAIIPQDRKLCHAPSEWDYDAYLEAIITWGSINDRMQRSLYSRNLLPVFTAQLSCLQFV